MILDEPASAMDAKAEYEVFKRFREMTEGWTVTLISHRLSTLRMAHRIYLMQDGKIVETGTHDELFVMAAIMRSCLKPRQQPTGKG